MFNLRLINKVKSQTPCDPPVIYVQDDMSIHDFDRAMVNVSIRLSQDLVMDKLIWNTRVSMTKKEYARITNERHQLVALELLTRNWGIRLVKAKYILKAKTQDSIR